MLEHGLDGNIVYFIKNFLTNKTFKVRVNNILSESKIQENGVAQGSILSATLFLIALNKINEEIKFPVQISLFADDLVIYVRGKNVENTKILLQEAIRSLEKWARQTGFRFSIEKTKAVYFTKQRKYKDIYPKILLNNEHIQYTETTKFLGITLDRKLTWKPHLLQLKTNCMQRLNLLKTIGQYGVPTNMFS